MRKRLERLPKGENKPAGAPLKGLARGCESGLGDNLKLLDRNAVDASANLVSLRELLKP